ncbi:MAG: hypothetical protein J0G28_14510 [Afipia sp.]|nr:hypothetical protein [Afipia sp.]
MLPADSPQIYRPRPHEEAIALSGFIETFTAQWPTAAIAALAHRILEVL